MSGGIGRASALLASGTVVSRVLGFVKAIVIAQALGGVISTSGNAFAVATIVPNSIYAIIGGGLLSAILVPQIVRASSAADGGNAYINKLVTLGLTGFAAVAVAATLAAPALVQLFSLRSAASFDRDLAIAFAYWCLPQVFFLGMYALLGEVLNARRAFGPFTWAPVANNIVGIASVGTFLALFGGSADRRFEDWSPGMVALFAGGNTLGLAAQALLLFLFWRRVGLRFRPDFRWRGVGLGIAGKAAGWTFAMLLIGQVAGLIETNVATRAGSESASVFALTNAWLIFMLPHSVITVSIVTVFYTSMSEHAARDDLRALKTDISSVLRGVLLAILLAAAALIVVAPAFARVFIATGYDDVQQLAAVIIAYLLGLVPFCLLFVVQRAFYALGDTRTPFVFTLLQSLLVIGGVLACSLLPADRIAVGIAAVVSAAGTVQLLVAAALLARRIGPGAGAGVGRALLRDLIAVLPACVVGAVLLILLGGTAPGGFALSGIAPAVLSIAVIGGAMSVVYLGALLALRSPDLRALLAPLLDRSKRH
jgi:putative peptidoglycan lipid II flippase